MKLIIRLFVVTSVIVVCINAGTKGKISGRVVDVATRSPVVGANVVVLGTMYGAATDNEGYFNIISVPPGTYEVQASCLGFRGVKMTHVVVNIDKTTSVEFSLTEMTLNMAAVEVVAPRETIVRDRTSTQSEVTADEIKVMPVEGVNDILSLQAGVTTDAGGGIHMRGGRSSELQYYVDGMPVSNPFGGGIGVEVQKNMIQELQVISGTFNAEYGQAMSGIVNLVTRDGGERFSFTVSSYSGDFWTAHTDVFIHTNVINPLGQKYVEGSVEGPLHSLGQGASFFIAGRYQNEENWLYGIRRYNISDTANFNSPDPSQWTVQHTGDNSYVPLNRRQNVSYQGKVSFYPIGSLKLSGSVIADNSDWRQFSHAYMYDPDYLSTYYSSGVNALVTASHTLAPNYIQELALQFYRTHFQSHARSNPFDSAYVLGIQRNQSAIPSDLFAIGRIDPWFYDRQSGTTSLKYVLTGQVDRYNLVKFGAVYRHDALEDNRFAVRRDQGTNWQLQIDPTTSFSHNYYSKKPIQIASYIQDKVEVEDFIINAGLRFDYFNAQSEVPTQADDPANKRQLDPSVAYRKTTPKQQLSPRFGLAFPISDNGKIHASYGHFFQIPDFSRLYDNPEYEVTGIFQSFLGNADLDAQRTVICEIGLEQRVLSNVVLDATCYYKDIRNLLGTELYRTFDQDAYGVYANNDYGYVWGITLSFNFLRSGQFSGRIDYTYQTADGNGSDPQQAYLDAQHNDESAKSLVPLNWDQRHVLNGVFTVGGDPWYVTFIGSFQSGLPYTPLTTYSRTANIQLLNEGRRASEFNVDVRAAYRFELGGVKGSVFATVQNLFDVQRIDLRPELTHQDLLTHAPLDRFNTLYEYRFDPSRQPMPRLMKFGFEFSL